MSKSLAAAFGDQRHFIIYRKADKTPVDPLHADPSSPAANSNAQDPATHLILPYAMSYQASLGAGFGVGIVITEGSQLFAIDLDGCITPAGILTQPAHTIVQQYRGLGAYVERSMSGRGVHIIGSYAGPAPDHVCKNTKLHFELYSKARYIALTGDPLEGAELGNTRADCTSALWSTVREHFQLEASDGPAAGWTTEYDPACTIVGTVDERIAQALKMRSMGAKLGNGKATFADCWNCNTEVLSKTWPGNDGKDYDASSADQSMFNGLAFVLGNNCEAMERVALEHPDCKLRREKWAREDYMRSTILKAVALPKKWKARRATLAAGPTPAAAGSTAPPPPPPAQNATRDIDIAAAEEDLPAVEAELQRAREALAGAEKLDDQAKTHETRNWVKGLERDLERLRATIGDRPRMTETKPGDYISTSLMANVLKGFTYVNDIHRIIGPSGFMYDSAKFDAHPRFAGRNWQMEIVHTRPSKSAWDAFVHSELQQGVKVEQCYFDPRDPPGHIKLKEGVRMVNTWRPVPIRMTPGEVTLFLDHLRILYPKDWRVLLNYLKFMMQHKGVKIMWWLFLQGVPGNGKSFISATMEYCMGYKFTQRPTPKNIDSQFNASLYACLFLALEDIKETDDFGKMWDTLKPMVTEPRLEIQPKGVDKVTREVCFNGIMNSNFKIGIKKDADDRRIASFFSAQQREPDLKRDGLTEEYFNKLWGWAQVDGWAHVAHYLLTDPIDPDFSYTKCPVTSSTAEHIRLSRPPAQQILLAAVRAMKQGFKGGWVNMAKFHEELIRDPKTRYTTASKQQQHAEALGYLPHPGLPEGQLTVALADGSQPVLYVTPDHPALEMTNTALIVAAYLEAQK